MKPHRDVLVRYLGSWSIRFPDSQCPTPAQAKDATAAAGEETLALQSSSKASDAADQDGGKVTAHQPIHASHAHASLSRSGAFSASDVEVAAAASEAAAVPKEPGDVTPYNGPWNAFATAAAASIAATAASAAQTPAGAAAAGVAPIQPSLSRPADAEQGSLHSVILGASGALAAVKELGHWRSRARTMAAGNRVRCRQPRTRGFARSHYVNVGHTCFVS